MSCLGKGDISLKISVLKWYRKPISCNTTEKRFSMMGVWSEWHYCLDFVPSVMLQGSRQPTFPALQSHICWCWKLGKRVSVYWRVLQSAVCNLLLTWIECRGNMISQVRAKNNSLTTWSYMTNTGRVPYFLPSCDVCIHLFIKWFIKRHKVITSKAPFFPEMVDTISSTHYTYPGRDGQAECAWINTGMVDPPKVVRHQSLYSPGSAWLMWRTPLPLRQPSEFCSRLCFLRQKNLVGQRGLMPDSSQQTFRIAVQRQLKVEYERIFMPVITAQVSTSQRLSIHILGPFIFALHTAGFKCWLHCHYWNARFSLTSGTTSPYLTNESLWS